MFWRRGKGFTYPKCFNSAELPCSIFERVGWKPELYCIKANYESYQLQKEASNHTIFLETLFHLETGKTKIDHVFWVVSGSLYRRERPVHFFTRKKSCRAAYVYETGEKINHQLFMACSCALQTGSEKRKQSQNWLTVIFIPLNAGWTLITCTGNDSLPFTISPQS